MFLTKAGNMAASFSRAFQYQNLMTKMVRRCLSGETKKNPNTSRLTGQINEGQSNRQSQSKYTMVKDQIYFASKRIVDLTKKAWRITFPNEEDEIRKKFQHSKKEAQNRNRFTSVQLERIQKDIPEHLRTALVTNTKQEKLKKGILERVFPDILRNKFVNSNIAKEASKAYKNYRGFKEDLKQYVCSQNDPLIQAYIATYEKIVGQEKIIASAINQMRQIDQSFEINQIETAATVIFVSNYQCFLQNNLPELEQYCCEQALSFFKQNLNFYHTKRMKPKFNKLLNYNGCFFLRARICDKSLPIFVFQIVIQEIHCFQDHTGRIVDGDQQRIIQSTYQFGIRSSGNKMEVHGHNWEVVEIKKINEMKLLV